MIIWSFHGGLNLPEIYDPWETPSKYNTNSVYKNSDPATETWERHSDLLRPRASHSTIYMKDQIYHIAGYATDWSSDKSLEPEKSQSSFAISIGRKVELWKDLTGDEKVETGDILFNYIQPQSFIVSKKWYHNCN